MTRLLAALVAALLAWCGAAQPAQSATSMPMTAVVADAYNGHKTSAEVLDDDSGRGTAAAYDRNTTYDAVGRGRTSLRLLRTRTEA